MSAETLSDFVSFCFICVHFCHEIEDTYFKIYRNFVIFCDSRAIMLDENISYGKIPDFVLFPLFVLALVIKLRDFGSQVIVTLFNFFDQKN